ncbi:class I SAM-dependent methyltransferase [Streptomyces sp. NA04227]|uniref:class I SAM-dependent methyltransferase n=1 Tax=Streptomyces sp. NA04227 TaxID=2742136 RepID=UPI001590CBA3|nr:class I SAM-dependent methyltransferase [Streptomyces sp. NA04227]QKW05898.1 class I SAM-dependent methyltransferase [Streptomyces sp. NA04227]
MTLSGTEAQARTLGGYDDASRLRQVHDRDWVLDRVTGEPEVLVDLGSGIGQLLQAALERHPSLRLAVGLERSEHRIAEAGERLRPYASRVALHQADLTAPAPLPHRADVVTMTSVLHWLFPVEQRVLAWVRDHLAPGGSFLLTTYHPARDEHGLGGEDDIVREALTGLGIAPEAVPGLLADRGVLPIATRTRPEDELASLLGEFFTVDTWWEREATVTVGEAAQYEHFHAATFGDYYASVLEPGLRAEFFRAVGRAGWRRQQERGRVSAMPVRLWRLVPRGQDSAQPRQRTDTT